MTLNQILYFQTVARHQHFRLAAAELSISQPSLSRSIAALEEELGIILFERKGRTVTLTKYGKLFLEHADRILDEVRLAQKHMKKLSGNAGHVDIGYVFPLAAHYIPHTVRRFLSTQKNKDVTFNFHQSHTGEMIHGLKNEKYDVIFGSYVEDEPDIQFVPILNSPIIITYLPQYVLFPVRLCFLHDHLPVNRILIYLLFCSLLTYSALIFLADEILQTVSY